MNKQIFDTPQNEVTLSSTGRVLICVNEKEVQEWVTPEIHDEQEEPAEPVQVTKYEYDTIWVRPIKQSPEAILQAFKEARIAEIDVFDTSDEVNSFLLNGVPIWLDSALRVQLRNRLNSEKSVGKTESVIWYNNMSIPMNIDTALQLLNLLEVYASSCYDVTANHKVAIMSAETLAEVGSHDISTGYPAKPDFSL